MFSHNIKISWRNLIKYRLQTTISVIGLAVGMTCFSLSALWMRYIENIDSFHKDADRICLLSDGMNFRNEERRNYITSDYFTEYTLKNCPEVESAVSFEASKCWSGRSNEPFDCVTEDSMNLKLDVNNIDKDFYSFFNIKLLEGTTQQNKNTEIVITDALAKRLFSGKSAIGKSLSINLNWTTPTNCEIVGVVEEWPESSLFHFDVLLNNKDVIEDRWNSQRFMTFFRFKEGINIEEFNKRFCKKTAPWGRNMDQQRDMTDVLFIPINRLAKDYPPPYMLVKSTYTKYFMILGAIVIFCALCNYLVSMVTRLRIRSREIALRRLLGSSTMAVIRLMSTETLLLFIISAVCGTVITLAVLPYFRTYSEVTLPLSSIISETSIYLVLITIIGIVFSGVTTLIILRTTQRTILNGHLSRSGSGIVDKIGIFIQLSMGVATIFCVIVMQLQLHHLMFTNALGLNKSNVGIIRDYKPISENYTQLIKNSPLVEEYHIDVASPFPAIGCMWYGLCLEEDNDKSEDAYQTFYFIQSKPDILSFYGMNIIKGRMAKEDKPEAMVNETACKHKGWKNPVGKHFIFGGETLEIVGVYQDIYMKSPTLKPDPQMIIFCKTGTFMDFGVHDIIFRAKDGMLPELLEQIDNSSEREYISEIIDFEEHYNKNMTGDVLLSKLMIAAMSVTVIISLIGVFSLVSLSLEQRRKEIAIRKVHGAKFKDILRIFIANQYYILLASAVVAFPASYYVIHLWMSQYIIQIPISWWIYPAIILTMSLLIFITVFWQIRKAAKENPAEVMKSE